MGRYRSAVRAAGAAETRELILAAFAAQLGQPGVVSLSLPAAAAEAGVGLRTVYHHFPDAEARLEALAEWAEHELGPIPSIDGVDDLPDHVRRAARA
jgi:AcrR family transcriptional regulator